MTQDATDEALQQAIMDLLHTRDVGKTICPSEASRAVFGAQGNAAEPMRRTRAAAARLVQQGMIVVTQRGKPTDLAAACGPIRLRLR